ncbi:MAG: M13 family peptidase, partial [Flavobacteriaceae bacterium]|nr:M13 family peptidase [Flavobacteriaceae bacterium]
MESKAEVEQIPGIDLSLMDKSVSPNEDFFKYVNGTWLQNNEIPADRTRWGSFDELRKKTDADALAILKAAMEDENLDLNSDQGKAVALFKTIMDTESRNNQGIDPVKPYLEKIDAINNIEDLQAFMIEMESSGGPGFFGFGVGADSKDSNKNTVYLG